MRESILTYFILCHFWVIPHSYFIPTRPQAFWVWKTGGKQKEVIPENVLHLRPLVWFLKLNFQVSSIITIPQIFFSFPFFFFFFNHVFKGLLIYSCYFSLAYSLHVYHFRFHGEISTDQFFFFFPLPGNISSLFCLYVFYFCGKSPGII